MATEAAHVSAVPEEMLGKTQAPEVNFDDKPEVSAVSDVQMEGPEEAKEKGNAESQSKECDGKEQAVGEEMLAEAEVPKVHADELQEASAEPDVQMASTEEAKEDYRREGGESKDSKEGSKDDGTKDAQAEPDVPVQDKEQEKPAEAGPTEEAAVVKETPAPEVKTPPAKTSASRKREKSTPKGPDLAAMALKIKRLQEEASEVDAAIAARDKKIQELEAEKAALASEAQNKRHAAHKVSQMYTRKKCEVAIAKLEGDVPKRPLNAYLMFCMDNILPGVAAHEQNKKRTEMWQNLAEGERKKYTDKWEAEMKKFRDWGASEEGQKNQRERADLIRQIKATGEDELAKALGNSPGTSVASPVKRPAMTSQDTPIKHHRVTPAEPALDDKVFEEASKADLVAQLKNLASRPEVVALGKSSQELWDALRGSSGMVNAAKRALVGA